MAILLRKLFFWITLLLCLTRLFKGAAQLQSSLLTLRSFVSRLLRCCAIHFPLLRKSLKGQGAK